MEEKDYALISDRELVDRLLIGDEEIVRYLFFDKCTPMFNYILHRFCPCQLDKNELINELYLYLQSDNWYKLRQFDFRSKLTTWLTVVAVRFFQKRKGRFTSLREFVCLRLLCFCRLRFYSCLLQSSSLRIRGLP